MSVLNLDTSLSGSSTVVNIFYSLFKECSAEASLHLFLLCVYCEFLFLWVAWILWKVPEVAQSYVWWIGSYIILLNYGMMCFAKIKSKYVVMWGLQYYRDESVSQSPFCYSMYLVSNSTLLVNSQWPWHCFVTLAW